MRCSCLDGTQLSGYARWYKDHLPYLVKFDRYNLDVDREGSGWVITAWAYRGPADGKVRIEARLRKVKTLREATSIVEGWAQPDEDGRVIAYEIERAIQEATQRKFGGW
jgi:hypothetical protein